MFYRFPDPTHARVRIAYTRPYDAPVAARAGERVQPVTAGAPVTDIPGWTWCRDADGREGWVPDGWCAPDAGGLRLLRDFDALELTVAAGDRLRLIHSESGFVFAETTAGTTGWVPDAVLVLEE